MRNMKNPTSARASHRRKLLITAMLQQPSLEKAAESVRISTVTAWRIRKTPEFQEEYRQARETVIVQAMGHLQHAASIAAATLVEVMCDPKGPPSSRVTAADRILKHAIQFFELQDLTARIERLEKIEASKANDQRGT